MHVSIKGLVLVLGDLLQGWVNSKNVDYAIGILISRDLIMEYLKKAHPPDAFDTFLHGNILIKLHLV